MRKIVGLLGVKGSGKDTSAHYLVEGLGFRRIGFADALYQEVADAFGVTVEFLSNRNTKETPLPQLALRNCNDKTFVTCYLHCEQLPESVEGRERPLSPRKVLQIWGTEYRRKGLGCHAEARDDYWLRKVGEAISAEPTVSFVITDVRFRNEYDFVKAQGGVLGRVRRPLLEQKEAADRLNRGSAAHASETELLQVPVDAELLNEEGNPSSLRSAVYALAGADQLAIA